MKSVGEYIDQYRVLAIQAERPAYILYIVEQLPAADGPLVLKSWKMTYPTAIPYQLFGSTALAIINLKGPSFLPVKDYGVDEGDHPYLVLPYEMYTLQTLQQRLERSASEPISQEMAWKIFVEVGTALVIAHRRGIEHGSLTPEDILLTSEGKVMVTGFAPLEAYRDQQHMFAPPSPYRPPEADVGYKSDQYALAALAHELLINQQAAPAVTPTVQQAIQRARADQEEQRFGTVREFLWAVGVTTVIPGNAFEEKQLQLRQAQAAQKQKRSRKLVPGAKKDLLLMGVLLFLGIACLFLAFHIPVHVAIDPNIPVTCNGEPMTPGEICQHISTSAFGTDTTGLTYEQQAEYQQSSTFRTFIACLGFIGSGLMFLGLVFGLRALLRWRYGQKPIGTAFSLHVARNLARMRGFPRQPRN